MSEWDATSFEAKDNLLRVVRREAEQFFDLVTQPGAWQAVTACTGWEVRDVVGHLVDTTEGYFTAFDAGRSGREVAAAYGLPGMAARVNNQAREFREVQQQELMERLREDFAKMQEMFQALGREEWAGLAVPHFYMGPLPAYFYPVFQLMDYGVHSWDIRQGSGRAHGLSGDAADLLVPFMFILWQSTVRAESGTPQSLGIRITSGHNAGDWRVTVGPDGMSYETGAADDLPCLIEFDPGSFVLTTFGRSNAGTIRGDVEGATQFLNLFFRI